MVWRDVSIVDQRQDFVMLASCEGVNVSELCRRFDISRQTGYLWLRRFAGLEALVDRSRRPLTSPQRSSTEVETAILAVRDAHPAWGARKICACLRQTEMAGVPAASTVHAVLKRHGRIAPDAGPGKAYERFEKEAPNLLCYNPVS
jgi:transposase-like protein